MSLALCWLQSSNQVINQEEGFDAQDWVHFGKIGQSKLLHKDLLKSGYHQVCISDSDIAEIAFRTKHGHFEFVRIPLSLIGASSTLNDNTMHQKFAVLIGKCVFIFCDDMLVFSSTYEQHLFDVEKAFQILEEN